MTENEMELIEKLAKHVAELSKSVEMLMKNQLVLQGHIKELYVCISNIHRAIGLKIKKREIPNATC
jgi:hypothetical protein